jgi:hypothetical protein
VKRLAGFRDAVFETLDAESEEGFDCDANTALPAEQRHQGFVAAMALATVAMKLQRFLSPRERRARRESIVAKSGTP